LRKLATQSDPTALQADIRIRRVAMELHKPQSQTLARAQTPTLAIPTCNGGATAAAQQRNGGATAAAHQRSSSLPIKIAGGYDVVGAAELLAAQSLKARASDADWRALLFWERMGKPAQLDPRKSPTRSDASRSGRRSPSPRSVAFDVPPLHGEDALFALEV
jgi:hypothetical protein